MNASYSPSDSLELEKLQRLANQLDSLFLIPGTKIRIGLENILSFVPVVGDALALLPSLFILRGAHQLGARPLTMARMIGNLVLDFGIGAIPIVGDLFDIAFNANLRNVDLIKRDLARRYAAADHLPVSAMVEK